MAAKAPSSTRRTLIASLVGTGIECYDFNIYTTAAALVFGELFFPKASHPVQQMLSFATIAVAFAARPLGSIFFGHFGDRVGRKSTLVVSLLTMGISTTLVACLPTYHSAGWIAALMLCVLRFGQGFGLGGEWGGAVLLAVENAPPGSRARYGMFPQLGVPTGFIAANGLFLTLGAILTPEQFQDWGWRIPFALSAMLVGVGLWIRLKLTETPQFAASLAEAPPPTIPLGELVTRHFGPLAAGTIGAIVSFTLYYVATAFALGYGTKTLGYGMRQFLAVQLAAIPFMVAGIYASARLADLQFDERRMLILGCIAAIASGVLLAPLMRSGSLLLVFLFLALAMTSKGMIFGPLASWLASLFPARVRYTGVSMAFNVAGVLGGGLTPLVSQTLVVRGGLSLVGAYCSAAAAMSLVALLFAGRAKGLPISQAVTQPG
ncbi:MFS transporter [Sphingomonas sp.]|uniref:MFS transporter n=1 Tax=Sphingomonas sp. TaxID=28214 RepID=UPI003B3BBCE5